MSRKLSVLLFSILAITYQPKVYPIDNYKVNQRLNVLASSLNMRTSPSIKAKVIRSIPYGARVRVLSKTRNRYLSNGIKGYWVEVLYKNKVGYIFDGYLTRFPVPHKSCKTIEQYANKHLTRIAKPKYTKNGVIHRYKGAKIIIESGHEYGFEMLIIKGMSLEEAYLISKLCYSKNKYPIHKAIKQSSFKLNKKGEIHIIELDSIHSDFGSTYSLKIKKSPNGYTYIDFGYTL